MVKEPRDRRRAEQRSRQLDSNPGTPKGIPPRRGDGDAGQPQGGTDAEAHQVAAAERAGAGFVTVGAGVEDQQDQPDDHVAQGQRRGNGRAGKGVDGVYRDPGDGEHGDEHEHPVDEVV